MLLTLIHKQHVTDNVWAFRFAPAKPLHWTAGQFVRIEVPHQHPDAEGMSRQFTIAAAPHEGTLTIATRVTQTTFKQALDALKIGDAIPLLETPAGDFVWRSKDKPLLFCAQGIGITPFYAIIKDRHHRGLSVNADLVYAHQPDAGVVFVDELESWAREDDTFNLKHFSGTVLPEDLAELHPDYAERLVYISGPKSFIKLCAPPYKLPIQSLKQDNFPGYAAANY